MGIVEYNSGKIVNPKLRLEGLHPKILRHFALLFCFIIEKIKIGQFEKKPNVL